MIVEELEVRIEAQDIDAYLHRDREVWTPFLAAQPGFVRKEVWVDEERGRVLLQVWWRSREHLDSVSDRRMAGVDDRMGEWRRPYEVRTYHVRSFESADPGPAG